MKIELTNEQTGKLVDIWRRTGGLRESLEAVLSAYEEMRPKEAAPVMWRRLLNFDWPKGAIVFLNKGGEVDNSLTSASTNKAWITEFYLTKEDLLSIPFPADPTPEEKAEAEFEAFAKLVRFDLTTNQEGEWIADKTNSLYLGFMAAKFPAGKEGAK